MQSWWQRWRGGLILAALVTALAGCGTKSHEPAVPTQPFRGLTVTVAAVGSRDQAIVETVAAQRGEWAASQGAEVVIRGPIEPESVGGVDVLVFPGDRLGDLVDAGALAVLPETLVLPPAPIEPEEGAGARAESGSDNARGTGEVDPLRFPDIAPAFRDQVAKYGTDDRMAFPYGGTALVLVYDRAAFEGAANRAAAEGQSLALQPPRTWEQLDALARFFQGRDWDGDGTPDHGIALALGPDTEFLGESIFLARAASLGQYRDQYSFLFHYDTMVPRIDSPPFVQALEALLAWKQLGPPGMESFDGAAARGAFRAGKVALLIDRAEMAARWSHGKASIGVAPLPGSGRVYNPTRKEWEESRPANDPSYLPLGGGWLVGVSRTLTGTQRDAAIDLARYLISPDTARRVRADRTFPMLPVRSALLGQGPPDPRAALGVDARQWTDAINQTLVARRVVPGLRIPQADGYLADLARERLNAIGSEQVPAASALEKVALAWSRRTKELGVARQTWHYSRSLNTVATTPEPPER